jgi:hypothetical protein
VTCSFVFVDVSVFVGKTWVRLLVVMCIICTLLRAVRVLTWERQYICDLFYKCLSLCCFYNSRMHRLCLHCVVQLFATALVFARAPFGCHLAPFSAQSTPKNLTLILEPVGTVWLPFAVGLLTVGVVYYLYTGGLSALVKIGGFVCWFGVETPIYFETLLYKFLYPCCSFVTQGFIDCALH